MEKLDDIETAEFERDRSYFEPRNANPEDIRNLHERINRLEVHKNEMDNIVANTIERLAEIQNWIDKIAKSKHSPTG